MAALHVMRTKMELYAPLCRMLAPAAIVLTGGLRNISLCYSKARDRTEFSLTGHWFKYVRTVTQFSPMPL